MTEMIGDPLEPDDAGGLVALVIVDRPPPLVQLLWGHSGVTHQHHLVVRLQRAQQVLRAHFLVLGLDVPVESLIDAVVEIVVLEVFEVRTGVRGREEQTARLGEWLHGPAYVHQQQQLDSVLPAPHPLHVDVPGVLGRGVNRPIEVQLILRPDTIEVPQAPECHLDLADVQSDVAAVVAELPILGNLNGAPPPRLTPHSDSGRVPAGMAERAGASPPDPVVAPVVLFRLFRHPLLKLPEQLLEIHHVEHGLFFLSEFLPVDRVLQPLQDLPGDVRGKLQAGEELLEGHIILIEVRLALDQHRPGQVVEFVQVGDQPL